jgi:hypothetical protein
MATDQSGLVETMGLLTERIAELELALEDSSWMRQAAAYDREFSREGLRQICKLAQLMFLKNPLIQRGVLVQRYYVFGQGMSVRAENKAVDAVVQSFWGDPKNQSEISSQQALGYLEQELALTGNLFLAMITTPQGRVRVRSIPMDEVEDIITNPDDANEPWYYKRTWTQTEIVIETGATSLVTQTAYYPDWRYNWTTGSSRPTKIGNAPVHWDTPVYHVRVGGTKRMRFGVPEIYAAIDWARAYNGFLEDWATLTKALSKFAWKLTTKGGKNAIAAAKARLATTLSTSTSESNPAPVAGSTFIGSDYTDMAPIPKTGANVSAEDGRRLMLMVAAATGLPESFFGDVSIGTLATAKSLDRPTELKMMDRQALWADLLRDVFEYVIRQAVAYGRLDGEFSQDEDGEPIVILGDDPETDEPMSAAVSITFPPILEHDVAASINAIVQAATLGGMPTAGTMDGRTLTTMLLNALGIEDVQPVLDLLDKEPEPEPQAPSDDVEAARYAKVVEAARELMESYGQA